MTFTPEQIAAIDQMITERLSNKNQHSAKPRRYHTVPELRVLIAQNIDSLRNELGDDEFDINVLRFVLKRMVTLRELDTELVDGTTRFDMQVGNAIRSDGWTGNWCPIQSTGRIGKYKIARTLSLSLFDAK